VRETRFDPLHDAASEQQLFDALDAQIATLVAAPEVTIEVETPAAMRRIVLPSDRVREKAQARITPLLEAIDALRPEQPCATLITPTLAGIPGFVDALTTTVQRAPLVLDEDAAVRGAARNLAALAQDGDALRHTLSLPATTNRRSTPLVADSDADHPPREAAEGENVGPAREPTRPATSTSGDTATHLLVDSTAFPLGPDGLTVGGPEGVASARYPVALASLSCDGERWLLDAEHGSGVLAIGDVRVLGPERAMIQLIRVEGS